VCGAPPIFNHLTQVLKPDKTVALWCGVCPDDGYEMLKDADGYVVHIYEDEAIGSPDRRYDKLGYVNVELLAAELDVEPGRVDECLQRLEADGLIYRADDGALVLLNPDRSLFARLYDREPS